MSLKYLEAVLKHEEDKETQKKQTLAKNKTPRIIGELKNVTR